MQDRLTGENEAMAEELALRTAELEQFRSECLSARKEEESASRRTEEGVKSVVLLKQQLIDEQKKHVSEVRVLVAEREEVQKQKEGISSTMRQSWTSQQATLEEELRVERERGRELVLRLQHEGNNESSAVNLAYSLRQELGEAHLQAARAQGMFVKQLANAEHKVACDAQLVQAQLRSEMDDQRSREERMRAALRGELAEAQQEADRLRSGDPARAEEGLKVFHAEQQLATLELRVRLSEEAEGASKALLEKSIGELFETRKGGPPDSGGEQTPDPGCHGRSNQERWPEGRARGNTGRAR